jgi:hypothetical protein
LFQTPRTEAAAATRLPLKRKNPTGGILRGTLTRARIRKWEPGAADKALAEIKRERPNFSLEGGSWTNNISWVEGYENLLKPMEQLSAQFHEVLDGRLIDKNTKSYRNALYHLLMSETSDFRYWGQATWTDYGREICRRGAEILAHDFR